MPYYGEHAARIVDPKKYVRFRRKSDEFGKGVDVIYGITRAGKVEVQAIRFKTSQFGANAARQWLKDHDYSPILFEVASTAAATEGSFSLANPEKSDWEERGNYRNPDGIERKRFRKELIRTGHYEKQNGAENIDITPALLNHWVKTFSLMATHGVRVPLSASPVPHADTEDPNTNAGWLVSVDTDGASLFGSIEVIGKENIEKAVANDVSIYSPQEWTDGKGNVYERPITHVALTPYPVVAGLSDWTAIAASFTGPIGSTTVGGSKSSADGGTGKDGKRQVEATTGGGTPGGIIKGEDVMTLEAAKKLGKELGMTDNQVNAMTDDSCEAALTEFAKTITKKSVKTIEGDDEGKQADTQMADPQDGADDNVLPDEHKAKVHELLKAVHPRHRKAMAAEMAKAVSEDDEVAQDDDAEMARKKKQGSSAPAVAASHTMTTMKLMAENRKMKLDSLVEKGHITPAVAARLGTQFVAEESLALSLSGSGKSDGFDELVEALKENKVVAFGERTGAQSIIQLSDDNRTDKTTSIESNPLVKDSTNRLSATAGK